ncbi:MAG: hypothetical protein M0P64_04300 [Candidatus Pacebacteria bacterium]|jgi:hypothetical protein|nr:hypothetical protein [Candidatus Paceibacterota bacterium]
MLKKYKKLFIVLGVIAGALVLLQLNHLFVRYKIESGAWVNYNGKWYTSEEDLRKDFPPQYIDVPAKNTPEEVYTEFRQALLNNQIDNALTFVRKENRAAYAEAFKDGEKFDAWVKTLPASIGNLRINDNWAHYDWEKGDGLKHTIDFGKDSNGYWYIEYI